MGRPRKLNTMTQVDGKIETFQPTTLDQIWGDTGNNKYGTMDEVVYAERLKSMNKSDLQTHATQVGLVPVDDRERLTKRLLHEFKLYVSSYRHPTAQAQAKIPISPEVAKILTEGR
jgi:hypothetical protein